MCGGFNADKLTSAGTAAARALPPTAAVAGTEAFRWRLVGSLVGLKNAKHPG